MEEFLLCIKDVAITESLEVSKVSSTIRKLEVGEVLEVLGARTTDKTIGLERQQCRTLQDGVKGWVTLKGNQGTSFMKPTGRPYLVAKDRVSLQSSLEPTSSESGSFQPGEVLSVLEGPRRCGTGDVVRVKCKADKDGKVGWLTQKDSSGTTNIEAATVLTVTRSTLLTEDFDVGKTQVKRKLDVGETLKQLNDELKEDAKKGIQRARVQAVKDGVEGWATFKGSQGGSFVEESTVHRVCKSDGLPLQASVSSSSKLVRKLAEGETFQITDEPRRESVEGALRARVRSLSSSASASGWVTVDGSVKAWAPMHSCLKDVELRDGPDIEKSNVLRTLTKGERIEAIEAPAVTSASEGKRPRMLRVRVVADAAVGYVRVVSPEDVELIGAIIEE